MAKAWIENNAVRDVCPEGLDPVDLYGEAIGSNYTIEVLPNTKHGFVLIDGVWQAPPPPPPPPLNKGELTAEIDAAVAAITARYSPFLEEYKTREAQAREFAAADFTGPVPQQVAAFATPAGKTPQEATQIIIGQADGLRTASDLLGVQRMRKYEVLRAATDAEAIAAHANVMATIAAIGAQIG